MVAVEVSDALAVEVEVRSVELMLVPVQLPYSNTNRHVIKNKIGTFKVDFELREGKWA